MTASTPVIVEASPTIHLVATSLEKMYVENKQSYSSCSNMPLAVATGFIKPSSKSEATNELRRSVVRFGDDPVSDVFIVNRVDDKYKLELFYQPEDFTLFRHERNMEIREEMERMINSAQQQEEEQQRRPRLPKRDSMDLRSNQLESSRGGGGNCHPQTNSVDAPSRITRRTRCSMDMTISINRRNSNDSSNNNSRSPARRRPMRPCSRTNSAATIGTRSSAKQQRGRKPMALAA